jgi:hypothetical protein
MSNELFWLDESCPVCHQGRLFIIEDIPNQRLYLHCEECEMAWLKPEDLRVADKGFLAINPDFETRMPSTATIKKFGWTKYELRSIKNEF